MRSAAAAAAGAAAAAAYAPLNAVSVKQAVGDFAEIEGSAACRDDARDSRGAARFSVLHLIVPLDTGHCAERRDQRGRKRPERRER